MDEHNDAVISLAALIVDQIPENGKIADGHPVWSGDAVRFLVNWELSEAPVGRRQRRVIMIFSRELLEALGQSPGETSNSRALDLLGDAIAEKFDSHHPDVKVDEWLFTEDLLLHD